MSVENENVVDSVSTSSEGKVVLSISDHLPWEIQDHLYILQSKINKYLTFVESGQVFESYKVDSESKFVIDLIAKFDFTPEALTFLKGAKKIIENAGIEFRWRTLEGV